MPRKPCGSLVWLPASGLPPAAPAPGLGDLQAESPEHHGCWPVVRASSCGLCSAAQGPARSTEGSFVSLWYIVHGPDFHNMTKSARESGKEDPSGNQMHNNLARRRLTFRGQVPWGSLENWSCGRASDDRRIDLDGGKVIQERKISFTPPTCKVRTVLSESAKRPKTETMPRPPPPSLSGRLVKSVPPPS